VIGFLCFCQLHGLFQGLVEVFMHQLPFHAATQEIGPEELAERRRVLGEAADATQLTGKATKGIVDKVGKSLGQVFGSAPAWVEGL
jgi:hypothetical protein